MASREARLRAIRQAVRLVKSGNPFLRRAPNPRRPQARRVPPRGVTRG